MPFFSPLMSLHYTLTFLTKKALKPAAISLTPVKTKQYEGKNEGTHIIQQIARHFLSPSTPLFVKYFQFSKKHLKILQSSPNCKDAFPVQPVTAYRRHASLRDRLLHFTLHNSTLHTQQPARVFKCNHPRCLTCHFLQEGETNYIFTAANEQGKITDHLSCKSKNLIYLIKFNKCEC